MNVYFQQTHWPVYNNNAITTSSIQTRSAKPRFTRFCTLFDVGHYNNNILT